MTSRDLGRSTTARVSATVQYERNNGEKANQRIPFALNLTLASVLSGGKHLRETQRQGMTLIMRWHDTIKASMMPRVTRLSLPDSPLPRFSFPLLRPANSMLYRVLLPERVGLTD